MADLLDVLRDIDPENDANWTADGLVRLSALPEGTKRQAVVDAAPDFTRSLARAARNGDVELQPPQPAPAAVAPPITADKEAQRQKIRDEIAALDAERAEATAKAEDAGAVLAEVDARYHAAKQRLAGLQGTRAEQFRESQQRYLRQQFENRKVRGRGIAALRRGLGDISRADAAMIRDAVKPAAR